MESVRRALILGSLGAVLVPHRVGAQTSPRVARVGILAPTSPENFGYGVEAFRDGLRERGWVEGQNLTIHMRYSGARYDRLPALAAELVSRNVDVILALSSPAVNAAKQTTKTVPIVIETLGDAISTGLVSNLARPGGNVTGVSGFAPELSGKRLELIRELSPKVSRIGVLANVSNPATPAVIRATEDASRRMGVQLHVVDIREPAAVDGAVAAVAQGGGDALLVVADPMLFGQRRQIVELAARHRLPAVYESRRFIEVGGLAAYGPDQNERFRQAADYVDRILKGAKPGDLPILQPSVFELVLNLRAAKSLGLTIPPALRLRANQVIE